jgi:ankyrin repeat protein
MARLLIEHGASVEAKDSGGETALEIASRGRHDEIVKLLIEHGAS